jgi:hypothetical protein
MKLPHYPSLALVLAVAVYFAIGCTLSLEYIDEGQIIYPSWLVSLGALPYRDFRHLYGPALFALNGALLRWVATDLLVIRISLVAVKTATVVLTYLLARRVAGRAFALLVSAVLVAVWGTPWWVFNTPYGNHYSLTLTLSGLACFLALPRRFILGCFLAGLCFGAAATFKHTAGVFALGGFALFLVLARDALADAGALSELRLPGWAVRAGRLAVLVGMLGFFALYLSPRNTAWNVLVLFTPGLLTVVMAIARDFSAPVRPGMRAGLFGIAAAGLGAAVPVLILCLYYAAQGALRELVFNLVSGLPQQVTWFDPFPGPRALPLVALAVVAVGCAALAWRQSPVRSALANRGRALTVTAVLGAALGLVLTFSPLSTAALLYVRSRAWAGTFITMWFAVPLAAVWLTAVLLLRGSWSSADIASGRRNAVLLLYCNAVIALLLLYPAGDVLHVVMGLPAYLPLCAFLLERFHYAVAGEPERMRPSARWLSGAVIGALALCMAAPSLDHLVSVYRDSRADPTVVRRATAIHGAQPKFGEIAAVLAYLATEVPPDRELLVLSGEQMLYFLAGRRSALERDELALYLVSGDVIAADDARRLIDQQRAIARLAEARPVIVEGGEPRTDGRVRNVLGDVSRYIDAHYRVAATVANYRVLTWAAE